MKKMYEAPVLFVDEYVADTMIASSGDIDDDFWEIKNANGDNNQNCWGCKDDAYKVDGKNGCVYIEGTEAYTKWCG